MLANLEDAFLTADLCAEAAIDAGQSVDLHAAVLSPNHGGTLEPFQTEPAGNTGADSRHLDRRGRALLDTDTAARAFFIMNGIARFCLGDGALGALDHACVALIAGSAVETSPASRSTASSEGSRLTSSKLPAGDSRGRVGSSTRGCGLYLISTDRDEFGGDSFGVPVFSQVLSTEVAVDGEGRLSSCCKTFNEVLGACDRIPSGKETLHGSGQGQRIDMDGVPPCLRHGIAETGKIRNIGRRSDDRDLPSIFFPVPPWIEVSSFQGL